MKLYAFVLQINRETITLNFCFDFVPNIYLPMYTIFHRFSFLPLDEAIASGALFVIVSASDRRAETLLEPAK